MTRSLCVLALATGAFLIGASPSFAADPALYRYSKTSTFDGSFGPVAAAQRAIEDALRACGSPVSLGPYGWFGPKTRDGIKAAAQCPAIAPRLPGGSSAANGELTEALWRALLPAAPPSVVERARSLMLSFEATDYTRAEWNFCQSRPVYDPAQGRTICYSNDRKSYLTWGPNGATAGHGREVQNVMALANAASPNLIEAKFGSEASAVRRMLQLPEAARATETFLCGVWADPRRRQAWRAGFESYGSSPEVRKAYDQLYRSSSYDGGKIATFLRAYAAKGYTPTEVDLGFFMDRAAHTSVSYQTIVNAIPAGKANWEVRRAIALAVRPSNQRQDRLGRDVAYYVDGLTPPRLNAEERAAWQVRGQRLASDVGLSDGASAPEFNAGPALPPPPTPGVLTPAEKAACPAAVLATRAP